DRPTAKPRSRKRSGLLLFINEGNGIGHACTRGAIAVDLMPVVGKPERNAAYHATVVGQVEVTADQSRMPRQSCLRDSAETERLGRQHEISDISAAIDCAVYAERLVGVNDRDVRC